MPDQLPALLDAYNSGSLTAIAGFHGLVTKGAQSKAQSVASLSRALSTTAQTQKVAHELPGSARPFQRDLYLYWSFVRETPFRLTLKGQPPKPVLKTLAGKLLDRVEADRSPDETSQPRLRFVRLLLQELGLLSVSSERDLRVTRRADFFSLAPLERVRHSFETWRA